MGTRPAQATLLAAAALVSLGLICATSAFATEPPVTAAAGPSRTAWYPDEPRLTPQLLEGGGFGRNFETAVRGQVYAQPLVFGHTLLAATEDNWIYGIDSRSGEVEWERSVGTPWNSADIGCGDLAPHVGITGTPVIDPNTDIAYFFAKGYASGESGPAIWKMHAVDLASGGEEPGFPVTISGEAENLPGLGFDPTQQLQRPALLLMNGVVYAGFGSLCDTDPFHGWVVGVSTAGQIRTMWATTEGDGAAIWQGGGGLASDGEDQILLATGNSWSPPPGPGDEPPEGHLGDSVVRARVEPDGKLVATDFFSPFNGEELDSEDLDLGSSGPLVLPSPYFGTEELPHLLVQVGKAGVVYLLNRDDLGGMAQGPEEKNADVGEATLQNGVWGSLATWPGDGGYVYIPASGEIPGNGALEILKYGTDGSGKPELTPVARATGLEFGSGSPIVTSGGATAGSGIVWISQCPESPECKESTLDAYAAAPGGSEPAPLWNAKIGVSTKFARPDASGERIYVGTRDGGILAFGPTHHTLTVLREGASGGSVRSDAEGIECGATCSHSFADGAQVTLTATPAAGFRFSGWSGGGCAGTGPCLLTMYSDTEVTAAFAPLPAEGGAAGGPMLPSPSALPHRHPPNTAITKAKIEAREDRASFDFHGTAGTRFLQCRLIGPTGNRRFTRCAKRRIFRRLPPGGYVFQVRAVGEAGADPTPATRRFEIRASRSGRGGAAPTRGARIASRAVQPQGDFGER